MQEKPNTDVVIYTTVDGLTKVEAHFDQDTVWLSLEQMSDLFQRDKSTISRHIKNVFAEGELVQEATVAKFATVQMEGARQVERLIDYYNLDVIISVGYRVKSLRGTQFRIWASSVLKEYMRKGFALDDERLKGNGGGNYWKELLDRIRDIRSSEKVLYRQVLDLYATSVDYDPNTEESVRFFKIVQNKLHFAAHGHTAAEVVYRRADARCPAQKSPANSRSVCFVLPSKPVTVSAQSMALSTASSVASAAARNAASSFSSCRKAPASTARALSCGTRFAVEKPINTSPLPWPI